MLVPKAKNNFVFVIRDETEKEVGGLIIPDSGKEKPHSGTIFSAGKLVRDPDIKAGKGQKCLFHKGVGREIEYNDKTYLVMAGEEIIALV